VGDAHERPLEPIGVEEDPLGGRDAGRGQGASAVAETRACRLIRLLSGLTGPG
jgi:hypothetical protein